jgi:hypothetical protein
MDELEAEFKEKDARLRAAHERELELYFCLFTMLQDMRCEAPIISDARVIVEAEALPDSIAA